MLTHYDELIQEIDERIAYANTRRKTKSGCMDLEDICKLEQMANAIENLWEAREAVKALHAEMCANMESGHMSRPYKAPVA